MTQYLVLANQEGAWRHVTSADAQTGEQAIRKVLTTLSDEQIEQLESREFVAVPERSWTPVRVELERKTKMSFTPAEGNVFEMAEEPVG